jgi:hypothetical protein
MNESPYQPPGELMPPEHLLRPERGRGAALGALVLMLVGTLLSGLVILLVTESFLTLAETGQADAEVLAQRMSWSMWATLLGLAASLAGGIIGLVAVFGAGNRERWFFFSGLPIALLQLVTFPLGTLFGILLLVGFLIKRKEFLERTPRPADESET